MKKTKRTSNRKNGSGIGLMNLEAKSDLNFGLSVAKGMLAVLELTHQSRSTKKLEKMPTQHLRILLLEAMDGICTAESALDRLSI